MLPRVAWTCLVALLVTCPSWPASARSPEVEASACRWRLPQRDGLLIEVAELPDADVTDIRRRLAAAKRTESQWTMLAVTIEVDSEAGASYRWSPPATSFVVEDARGERYGNVVASGRLEILPRDLREALGPCEILPGQIFRGLLLFRPTLAVDEIARITLRAGGRTQPLVAAR